MGKKFPLHPLSMIYGVCTIPRARKEEKFVWRAYFWFILVKMCECILWNKVVKDQYVELMLRETMIACCWWLWLHSGWPIKWVNIRFCWYIWYHQLAVTFYQGPKIFLVYKIWSMVEVGTQVRLIIG